MAKIIEIKLPQTDDSTGKIQSNRVFQIEYDESHQQEALNVAKLITTNLFMISDLFNDLNKISFIGSNEPSTLNINSTADLKKYLSTLIPDFMQKVINQVKEYDQEQYETMLLRILLMHLYKTNGMEIELPTSDEDFSQHVLAVYAIVGVIYHLDKNIPEKYLDFILRLNDDDKTEILLWLNDRNRFKLLNDLLHEQYQILIKFDGDEHVRDSLLQNHLDDIIEIIDRDFALSPISEMTPNYQHPTLTKEELDALCTEFFKEIDPTGRWLEKYNHYNQDQIVYSKKDESTTIDWCNFCDEDGRYVVIAPLSGTIADFRDLVHEISHIVSLEQLNDDETISPSLLEYTSIFMELQAIKFLRKKGYSQEVLDTLYIERNIWTAQNTIVVSPILRKLSRYLKDGEISLEQEQAYALEQIGDPSQLTEEDKQILAQYLPYETEDIQAKCDEYNDFLILHPEAVFKEYPYVIGKYLAVKTMDKEKEDPETLPRVLEIIENLKNENPEDVIEKLGLDVEALSLTDQQKKYVKGPKKTEN